MTEHQTSDALTRRVYKDRMGRPITDPRGIEVRYVQEQMRRMARRAPPERPWYAPVTVGELAERTGLTTGRIIQIVRDEIYLGLITETGGPVEEWGVGEDGE